MGIAAVAFLLFVGCAHTLPKYRPPEVEIIQRPFDDVWASLVSHFALQGWSIAVLEKESGIIGTDIVSVDRGLVHCGTPGFLHHEVSRKGKLTVMAVPHSDSATKVTVIVKGSLVPQ